MIDTTVFQNKTAVYYTLGCKLNFSETSTIGKILKDRDNDRSVCDRCHIGDAPMSVIFADNGDLISSSEATMFE